MILDKIEIEIDRNEVLRYLGYKRGISEISPEVDRLVGMMIALGKELAKPRASLITLDVLCFPGDEVRFCGVSFAIRGPKVARFLAGIERATLMVATVGAGLEERVDELFRRQEFAQASVLDAVGSEAAEACAGAANLLVNKEAQAAGFSTLRRFSPGYGDWDVRAQHELVEIAQGDRVGVRVNESSMLIPRKSVSAVIGWKKENPPDSPRENCEYCDALGCAFRR